MIDLSSLLTFSLVRFRVSLQDRATFTWVIKALIVLHKLAGQTTKKQTNYRLQGLPYRLQLKSRLLLLAKHHSYLRHHHFRRYRRYR